MFFLFHLPLFPLILILLIVILFFFHFKRLLSPSKTRKNQPPSPRKLPIIGNLHQLGSNSHRSLLTLTQKHGPLVLIQLGRVPVLVASSANAAREIMKTHDVTFSNRPKSNIPHMLTYGSKNIVFAPYGEYWRQIKSIAILQLLSNKRVQSLQRVREDEIRVMIDVIKESCGSLVDLSDLIVSLTNNVVCRVALGRTYQGLKWKDMLTRFIHLLGVFSVGDYIPWLSWVNRLSGLEREANKVAKEFNEFLEGVIVEHINKRKIEHTDDENDKSQDIVDILLDVQRDNTTGLTLHRDAVKGVLIDMFAAGTDTTSTSIEWAISELVRHPQAMKELQEEAKKVAQGRPIITEDNLDAMHYLKAVIKEALRLHPPVPLLVPRESTNDVKLMGYDIAKGTQVIINAWAIGHDPSLWEDAEEFKPERFLNNDIDYKGMHFELIPFGGGRRGCPGIQFAIVINELVLANLVYKFDFVLPNGEKGEELDMSETTGINVRKKFPLMVVATPT